MLIGLLFTPGLVAAIAALAAVVGAIAAIISVFIAYRMLIDSKRRPSNHDSR